MKCRLCDWEGQPRRFFRHRHDCHRDDVLAQLARARAKRRGGDAPAAAAPGTVRRGFEVCPRCDGQLWRDGEDMCCLQCGFRR